MAAKVAMRTAIAMTNGPILNAASRLNTVIRATDAKARVRLALSLETRAAAAPRTIATPRPVQRTVAIAVESTTKLCDHADGFQAPVQNGTVLSHLPSDRRPNSLSRMTRGPVLIAAAILFGTLSGCGTSRTPVRQDAVYAYTCCSKSDIEQVWRPGGQASLHWAAEQRPGIRSLSARYVVLSVQLAGPYSDALSLKGGSTSARTLAAPDVSADTWQSQRPVSIVILPGDLAPGLYNLCLTEAYSPGNTTTGCSIVQVGPP